MKKILTGLSLLELLISLGIIALILSLAYPSYASYLIQAKRTEGQLALLDLAAKLESYYAVNHTYVGATEKKLLGGDRSENGRYQLHLSALSNTAFTITASPLTFEDKDCGELSYNQLGEKGISVEHARINQCW